MGLQGALLCKGEAELCKMEETLCKSGGGDIVKLCRIEETLCIACTLCIVGLWGGMKDKIRPVEKWDWTLTMGHRLVEASYSLKVSEFRVLAFAIASIQPSDMEFKTYKFRVADLADIAGFTGRSTYKLTRDAVDVLLTTLLVIQDPKSKSKLKNAKNELRTTWFAAAKYEDGAVEIEFPEMLKPYLLDLRQEFLSRLKLGRIVRLESMYSVRLYLYLWQYVVAGTREASISDLRDMFGLGSTRYKNWAHFERAVIRVAQRELAEKTNLSFTYNAKRIGRRYESVRFFTKTKNQERMEAEAAHAQASLDGQAALDFN